AGEVAMGSCGAQRTAHRFEMFLARALRVDEKAGCDGERRPFRVVGKPGDAERAADTYMTAENLGREIGQAVELRGAAGQHEPAAGLAGITGSVQTVSDEFEGLLDARAHDAHQMRTGHLLA